LKEKHMPWEDLKDVAPDAIQSSLFWERIAGEREKKKEAGRGGGRSEIITFSEKLKKKRVQNVQRGGSTSD